MDAIDVLAESGANVNARAGRGETPLHRAIDRSLRAVRHLVGHGAHVNARDNDRHTPLHHAAIVTLGPTGYRYPVSAVVDFLLRSGADETARDI